MPTNNKIKAAIIVAQRDFQDEEYFITLSVLEKAGILAETISSKAEDALGVFGGAVSVDKAASGLKVADYDGFVFIGGNGMAKNLDNQEFQRLAQEANEQGKVIGAICIAPALLAKAGILKGKRATIWTNNLNKHAVETLKENGALYQAEPLVIDDKIVTANGPSAARKFGEALVELLKMD